MTEKVEDKASGNGNGAEMDVKERVEQILERLRPMLMMDGGNIELVDVKDGEVLVHLMGACGMCPSSTMTLKMGVERAIKEEIPEIERVVQV
ncbi:MAG: NifU family protein [Cyanobacteriota/Melainabacteria group bacterium]